MSPVLRLLIGLGVCGLIGSVEAQQAPAPPASPLGLFPAETGLVLRLATPDRTMEKVAAFVDAVQPGTGQFVTGMEEQLGQLISNPGLTGVDVTRDWYVAVVLSAQGQPVPVFAIPATDAAAIVDTVKEVMNSSVQGDWVLYTEKPAVVPAVTGESLLTVIDSKSRELLEQTDLAAVVNIAHLRTIYADQLEQARDQVNAGLNQLQFNAPAGMDLTGAISVYSDLATYAFQGIDDAKLLTLTASVSPQGVRLEDFLVAAPETATAKFFNSNTPEEMPWLEKLPRNQQAYFGMTGAGGMMQWGLKLSSQMSPQARSPEFGKLLEQLDQFKLGAAGGCFTFGPDGVSGANLMFGELNDEFKTTMRGIQSQVGTIENAGTKQTMKLETDAEQLGDLKVDILTIKQEFTNPDLDPLGIQQSLQEKLLGGKDGIQTRMVYEPHRTVSVSGSLALLERTLKALDADRTNGLEKHRGNLPRSANALGYVNLPVLYGEMLKLFSAVEGFPLQLDPTTIDNLNLGQSYVGAAVVAEENAARVVIEIPIDQIQGLAKLGAAVALTFQQAGGF